MHVSSIRWGLVACCVLTVILYFPLSPPPVGLDTRPVSSYSPWYGILGVVFIILQVLLNGAALVAIWRRPRRLKVVTAAWTGITLVFACLDWAGAGGPQPNLEVGILEAIYLASVVAAAALARRELWVQR